MRKRYRLVIEPRLKGGPAMTDREKESCEGDFVIEMRAAIREHLSWNEQVSYIEERCGDGKWKEIKCSRKSGCGLGLI